MMEQGRRLYVRAKRVIPGGNSLLSKRPEMFMSENWPSYFDSARGIEVVDLDGQKFKDYSIMGIGTNSLGYADSDVDSAVMKVIKKGNLSTLNPPEEVLLAEKLIELHPWASMARFARTGGEANAIAVRIARIASGKEKVAICGYHGWHDWYLSANLGENSSLDQLLLPGLSTEGLPNYLRGSTRAFFYNDIQSFHDVVDDQLGVVIMEVERNLKPKKGFLEEIRKVCSDRGIVLIFDECTSGFRETFGGLHLKYGVNPDIAMFGKALGNGYAITAVIGTESVMNCAQRSFISSTFWTERIGFVAALATLDKMDKINSWIKITETGRLIREGWREIFNEFNEEVTFNGIDALSGFNFKNHHALKKTFITKHMLSKGFLASNLFYSCTEHREPDCDQYLSELHATVNKMTIMNLREIEDYVGKDLCHDGFKRVN